MREFIRNYFETLKDSLTQVNATDRDNRIVPVDEAIERSVELIVRRAGEGKKVYLVGNGGSAAIASHQAVDLWKNARIPALAFNDSSLLTCISNDFGYDQVFEKPVEMFFEEKDILIAISSRGASDNILKAVEMARMKGGSVLSFSGFDEANPLRILGDLNFFVPSSGYGPVEITHLALIHAIVDTVIHLSHVKHS